MIASVLGSSSGMMLANSRITRLFILKVMHSISYCISLLSGGGTNQYQGGVMATSTDELEAEHLGSVAKAVAYSQSAAAVVSRMLTGGTRAMLSGKDGKIYVSAYIFHFLVL